MATKLTATLPDGSQSRIAWVLWMLAGLLASRLLASVVIFLEAGAELLQLDAGSSLAHVLLTSVQVLVPAALLAVALAFAETRLLMPRETWLGIAAGPLVMWLLVVQDAVAGDPPLMLSLAIPVTLATVVALPMLRYLRPRLHSAG